MSWLSRLLNVFRCDRLNRHLDDQIQFHSDARTEKLAQRAQEQAKRQLGHPLLCVVKTPSGSKFKQLSAGTRMDSLL